MYSPPVSLPPPVFLQAQLRPRPGVARQRQEPERGGDGSEGQVLRWASRLLQLAAGLAYASYSSTETEEKGVDTVRCVRYNT